MCSHTYTKKKQNNVKYEEKTRENSIKIMITHNLIHKQSFK